MGKGRARQLIAAAVPARPAGRHGRRRGISRGNGQEQNQGWAGLGRMRLRPDSRSAARCCRQARHRTRTGRPGSAGRQRAHPRQFPLVAPADSCQDPSSAGVRKGAGGSAVAGQRASLAAWPGTDAISGGWFTGWSRFRGQYRRALGSQSAPGPISTLQGSREATGSASTLPALLAPAQHAPLPIRDATTGAALRDTLWN